MFGQVSINLKVNEFQKKTTTLRKLLKFWNMWCKTWLLDEATQAQYVKVW